MSAADDVALHDALIAQGLATMGASPAWDRVTATLLVWMARTRTDEKFGANHRSEQTFKTARAALKAEYGSEWRTNAAARRKFDVANIIKNGAFDAHTARFYQPLWAAQRALVETPAPSLAAALFKARIAEDGEVWNDVNFHGDCAAVVDTELAKFLGEA